MARRQGQIPLNRLAALLISAWPLAAAHADEYTDWQKRREERFRDFEAARPAQDASIADLKTKTAAMIAAHAPASPATLDQPPVIWRTTDKPLVILDAPFAPRMVVIPAGEFTMGSPPTEPGRTAEEGPRRRVRIGYPFAVSMFPIIVGEYTRFVAETDRKSSGSCSTLESGQFRTVEARDWRNPGFPQTMISPATCIDFNDAAAYVAWLSKKTGQQYRLLSEAEYEYVTRAGTTTAYWWGNDLDAACAFANGLDQDAQSTLQSSTAITCRDGHVFTSPVGSFKPNAFGLHDIAGNVSSWTADCHGDYSAAPVDGSARTGPDCGTRALRGGSWASADLRSASRRGYSPSSVVARHGFRVARAL